jgi:hypothetical protein
MIMCYNFLKIILATCLFVNSVYSQAPSIEWQKCYGGAEGEIPYCINSTSDGGSIICGTTNSTIGGDITSSYGGGDLWVVKLNASGTLMWQKTLGGTGFDFGRSIEQTTDGGYIVAGFTSSNNSGDVGNNQGDRDYWIIKLTNSGTISWQKTYGGSGIDMIHSIHQTTDGGYIVAGESDSPGGDILNAHGGNDVWILKLNDIGNIQWRRSLGGTGNDGGRCRIQQTTDGGYIISAYASSTDGDLTLVNNMGNMWFVKLTSAGNIDWQKKYGNAFAAYLPFNIYQTNDGYVALISTWSPTGNATGNHGGTDYCVLKMDNLGNLIWQKSFGGSSLDEPHDIIPTADGGMVISGWTTSENGDVSGHHGASDYWVIKLSSLGDLLWQKALGGNYTDQSYSICQAGDGGYLVSGYSGSNNNGDVGNNNGINSNDFWIVKLTANVLPIELSIFNAMPKEKDVHCSWKTLQEINSHEFVIERSDDATYFTQIGIVAAAGNSSLPLDYVFTDQDAMLLNSGYLYYRLKMVDTDGSFKYSSTVKVKINKAQNLTIYPNPTVDQITASFTSSNKREETISIIDPTGKKIYQKKIYVKKGSNIIQINTTSFPVGTYILSVTGENIYVTRFIKVVR